MNERPLTFVDAGRYEIYCHHSPPAEYPEEVHETLQVCVPLERALYRVGCPDFTNRPASWRDVASPSGYRFISVV